MQRWTHAFNEAKTVLNLCSLNYVVSHRSKLLKYFIIHYFTTQPTWFRYRFPSQNVISWLRPSRPCHYFSWLRPRCNLTCARIRPSAILAVPYTTHHHKWGPQYTGWKSAPCLDLVSTCNLHRSRFPNWIGYRNPKI